MLESAFVPQEIAPEPEMVWALGLMLCQMLYGRDTPLK
jgi:hypothetical protein